jgi:hypothetical protein
MLQDINVLLLLPVQFKLKNDSNVFQGWDSTAPPSQTGTVPWVSVAVGGTNSLVKLICPITNGLVQKETLRLCRRTPGV